MDRKLKKLAEFSSVHPARLIGGIKKYHTDQDHETHEDNIGLYHYNMWDERHPKLDQIGYVALRVAGPIATLCGGVGLIALGIENNWPSIAIPTIVMCGLDVFLTVQILLEEGINKDILVCPLGTLVSCCGAVAGYVAYNTVKYTATLPSRLVAKGVLNNKIKKRNQILQLENGEEILANYNNAKIKNKELKYKQKLSLKQSKSIREANQIIEKTNKLNQQNQEIERNL